LQQAAAAYGICNDETVMADCLPTPTPSASGGGHPPAVALAMQVRRLTPRECERLMGFPDDYTDIKPKGKPTPDGPRYKALGNSWAVPVVRWIGKRIANEIA
jgi:DNA (cytosine-5)-methyltransferase 1